MPAPTPQVTDVLTWAGMRLLLLHRGSTYRMRSRPLGRSIRAPRELSQSLSLKGAWACAPTSHPAALCRAHVKLRRTCTETSAAQCLYMALMASLSEAVIAAHRVAQLGRTCLAAGIRDTMALWPQSKKHLWNRLGGLLKMKAKLIIESFLTCRSHA